MHTSLCVFDFASNELISDQKVGPSWLDTPKRRSLFGFVYRPVRVKRNKSALFYDFLKRRICLLKGKKTEFHFCSKGACLKCTDNIAHYSAVSCLAVPGLEN